METLVVMVKLVGPCSPSEDNSVVGVVVVVLLMLLLLVDKTWKVNNRRSCWVMFSMSSS